MNQNNVLTVIALAGLAWLGWEKFYGNVSPQVALTDSSPQTSPWYLNYNTPPVSVASVMSTLPQTSAGIQNDPSGAPCSTCSQLGQSWGSQY